MRARRALLHDVLVDGDQCAVYAADHVVVLSPIATTVLSLLGRGWAPADELVDEVEATHGSPPQGSTTAAVERILIELEASHIVELHRFGP